MNIIKRFILSRLIRADDVEWVAIQEDNDLAIRIGGNIYSLYKGYSIQRSGVVRPVGKREYGESGPRPEEPDRILS